MNTNPTTHKPRAPVASPAEERGHRWFAALYDRLSGSEERGFLGAMREQLLSDLAGDVLEIGAGTGANFEHYPPTAKVTALELDPFMLKRAHEKLTALERSNITLQQAPAERLPFGDASFDAVVSTLVLCTVRDVSQSLAEIQRVLRQGGRLHFIEHVRADGLGGRVQDLIRPIWGWFGAGCHPNRRTLDTLRAAGFDVAVTERRKMMAFVPLIRGTAYPDAGGGQ
jgi:ubiquinone/menaquinone biosynthesis C-methylase UbiE